MIIWPFEETGFAFSRYAVRLSSRQRTSACVEPGGNLGDLGELGVVCEAVATMLHIGQPAFGANEAMLIKFLSAVALRLQLESFMLHAPRDSNGCVYSHWQVHHRTL